MKTKKALKKLGAWKSFKEQMCIEGISHKEFLKSSKDGIWGAFDFVNSGKGLDYWSNIAVNIDAFKVGEVGDVSSENLWAPAIYKATQQSIKNQ